MHACSVMSNSLQPHGPRAPSSSVHGILQARILECIAVPSPRGSSQPRDWTLVSYVSCIGRRVLYHQYHLGSPYFCPFMANVSSHVSRRTSDPQSTWAEQGHWMQTMTDPNRWSQHGTFGLWDRTSVHHSVFKTDVPACCWTLWSASCMVDMPTIKSIIKWQRRIRYRTWLNSRSTQHCMSIWLRVSWNLFLLSPPVLRLHTKFPMAAWLRNTNNNQSGRWFL